MSRAYRVSVSETHRQVVRAGDHVSTRLELLEILPREAMAELLRQELVARGFAPEGQVLVRAQGGVTVTVSPESGTVNARAESSENVEIEATREGTSYDDWGKNHRRRAEAELREGIRKEFEAQASRKTAELQEQVTERLEGRLLDLRPELDQVVNRVTAEALKRKAAQIGQIKEMTEDPENGALTIVLEV